MKLIIIVSLLFLFGCARDSYRLCLDSQKNRPFEEIYKLCRPLLE